MHKIVTMELQKKERVVVQMAMLTIRKRQKWQPNVAYAHRATDF